MTNAFPPPSCSLSFATPQAKFANCSVSSLSWSTRTPSTKTSVEKRNLSVDPLNKFSKPRKKLKQTGGEDFDVSFEADNVDKDGKEINFFPMTDRAMDFVIQGKGSWEMDGILKGIKMRHHQAFMEKAFPPEQEKTFVNAQVKSACMKTCRPQSEIDYIIYVITHWQKGTEVKSLPPGPERDRLISFRCNKIEVETSTSISTSLRRCLLKYNKDIFFPVRKHPAKTRLFMGGLKGNEDHNEDENSSGDKSSSASLLEHVSVTHSVALEKKNKRQAASAEKEMKIAGEAASCNGVAPGAVVMLKVDYIDYRTHSHAQGLMGIVFDAKPTGGIKVYCDHGIITHSGGPGVYWVPATSML
jgi:hypothetical protein